MKTRIYLFILLVLVLLSASGIYLYKKKTREKAGKKIIENSTKIVEVKVDPEKKVVCPFCKKKFQYNRFLPYEQEPAFLKCPGCHRKIEKSLLSVQAATNLKKVFKKAE